MKTETNILVPIPGFNDQYTINEEGDVKSISRKKRNSIGRWHTNAICKMTQFIGRGYWGVNLTRNGKRGTQNIHRLLALTFIPNPENKCCVNHINGNKLDNRLINLEWVTSSENHLHAIEHNLCKLPRVNRRSVRNRCTGEVYPSLKAAAIVTDMKMSKLQSMLNRKSGTCLEYAA